MAVRTLSPQFLRKRGGKTERPPAARHLSVKPTAAAVITAAARKSMKQATAAAVVLHCLCVA